jgi:hypothetical protein
MSPSWAVCQDIPAAAAAGQTGTIQSPTRWPIVFLPASATAAPGRTAGPGSANACLPPAWLARRNRLLCQVTRARATARWANVCAAASLAGPASRPQPGQRAG